MYLSSIFPFPLTAAKDIFPRLCCDSCALNIGSFLAIGILWQLFHPHRELCDRRLAIDPGGIEGAMPQQRC